ncbi:MAG: GRAM domain-containing protein [Nitrososphaeria archaeon]
MELSTIYVAYLCCLNFDTYCCDISDFLKIYAEKGKTNKRSLWRSSIVEFSRKLCKGRIGIYSGYLLLTKNHLIFKPAKFGGFGKKVEIPLDSIVKVSSKKSLGGEENILNIATKEKEYNFSLFNLNNWLTKINELMS